MSTASRKIGVPVDVCVFTKPKEALEFIALYCTPKYVVSLLGYPDKFVFPIKEIESYIDLVVAVKESEYSRFKIWAQLRSEVRIDEE